MKRILILYPGVAGGLSSYLAPQRWKIRLAGFRLVLADDRIRPGDEQVYEECVELPPAEEIGEGWRRLRALLARKRIDAVVAQSEPALFLGGLVARALGTPGPALEGSLNTTSKWLSRSLLEGAGLPQPRFALARDAADVVRFAERESGWPVVLKAVASSRQRLVTVVHGPEEVEDAVARLVAGLPRAKDVQRLVAFCALEGLDPGCDPLRDFLVEAHASGAPLETEGLVQRGRVHSLGTIEQMQRAPDDFFIDGYLHPADRSAACIERLEELSRRALAALRVDDSGYAIEFREQADEATLIEVNGRLGWDEGLGEIFAAGGNRLPAVLAGQLALGRKLRTHAPRRAVAVAFHSQRRAGVVRDVPVLPKRRERGVLARVLHVRPGDAILEEADPASRPHLLHVIATAPRSSRAAYARAREVADALAARLLTTALVPATEQLLPGGRGDAAGASLATSAETAREVHEDAALGLADDGRLGDDARLGDSVA